MCSLVRQLEFVIRVCLQSLSCSEYQGQPLCLTNTSLHTSWYRDSTNACLVHKLGLRCLYFIPCSHASPSAPQPTSHTSSAPPVASHPRRRPSARPCASLCPTRHTTYQPRLHPLGVPGEGAGSVRYLQVKHARSLRLLDRRVLGALLEEGVELRRHVLVSQCCGWKCSGGSWWAT